MIKIKVVSKDAHKIDEMINSLDILSELGEACYEICKDGQKELRAELSRRNLMASAETWNSIQAMKQTETESVTVIRKAGVWIDSMKPHWVPLGQGYRIDAWVKQTNSPYLKQLMKNKGLLKVFPHPFIMNALDRTEAKAERIAIERVHKALIM